MSGWLGQSVHCPVTRRGDGPVSPCPHRACASGVESWPLACSLFYWRWHPCTASSYHIPVPTCSSALTPALCLSVCSATSADFGGTRWESLPAFPRLQGDAWDYEADLGPHCTDIPSTWDTEKEAFQLTGHRETLSNSAKSRPALTLTLCVIRRVNYMWSCSWHFDVL